MKNSQNIKYVCDKDFKIVIQHNLLKFRLLKLFLVFNIIVLTYYLFAGLQKFQQAYGES